MGIFFSRLGNSEFVNKDAPKRKYIRPCYYSMEERILNATCYWSSRGHNIIKLRLNQAKLYELRLNLGNYYSRTFLTTYGKVRLIEK